MQIQIKHLIGALVMATGIASGLMAWGDARYQSKDAAAEVKATVERIDQKVDRLLEKVGGLERRP